MFATILFAGKPFGYTTPSVTGSQDSIAFNGYGLQNEKIITSSIDFESLGDVELNSFKYPRTDGGGVLSRFYR